MNKSDRRGGMYWKGLNPPYVSVTTVLGQTIPKPALQHWYGQQIYLAMVADPSMDERTALASPYTAMKKAANRGTTVHSIMEAYKASGNIIETVPEEYKGYAKAFYSWVKFANPRILETEKTLTHEGYKYAGTLDMLAVINGKTCIVDFKTNKDGNVYNEAHLQVSAYIEALKHQDKPTDANVSGYDGIIVGLAEDGTFNHQIAKKAFKPFLHCLNLYAFLNRDKLIKLGWKGGGLDD